MNKGDVCVRQRCSTPGKGGGVYIVVLHCINVAMDRKPQDNRPKSKTKLTKTMKQQWTRASHLGIL